MTAPIYLNESSRSQAPSVARPHLPNIYAYPGLDNPHETHGFVFSSFGPPQKLPPFPSTLVVRSHDERRGEYEAGRRQPSWVLDTTLIFVGFRVIISPHNSIDQILRPVCSPRLRHRHPQPDFTERSEADRRAIFLSLIDQSIVFKEDPTAPQVRNYPPTGIVATSNPLYATLPISLLAAFVAMLGKQYRTVVPQTHQRIGC